MFTVIFRSVLCPFWSYSEKKKKGIIVSIGPNLCLLRFEKKWVLQESINVCYHNVRFSIGIQFLNYLRRHLHYCEADDYECGCKKLGVEAMKLGLSAKMMRKYQWRVPCFCISSSNTFGPFLTLALAQCLMLWLWWLFSYHSTPFQCELLHVGKMLYSSSYLYSTCRILDFQ